MDLGLPLVLEVGKLGQGHNGAFKKVTAPTGVAIVSMKQGFCPSPAVNLQDHRIRKKEPPLAYRHRAASRNLPSVEQEELPTGPPWQSQQKMDGGGPCRHHAAENQGFRQAPPSTSLGSEEEAPQAG
jgi:hypothetical protein